MSNEAKPSWTAFWKTTDGFNNAFRVAQEALLYLANNPRPIEGEAKFNSAHLIQIADELRISIEQVNKELLENKNE